MVGLSKLIPSETKNQSLANRVVKIVSPEMSRVLNLTGQTASIGETVLDLTPQLEADDDDVFLLLKMIFNSGAGYVAGNIYPTVNPNIYDYMVIASMTMFINSLSAIIRTDVNGQIHYKATLVGPGNYDMVVYFIGVATPIPDHKHDI